jgi:MFS family permease
MWTIAVLAFFSLFAEFLGEEWASVFYDRELHAKTTEFGYGNLSFNAAFIAVLLVGGPLADRLGPALIVRAGGVVFAVGMVAYATSQSVVIATAALAVAGLGAGNLVPLSLSGVQDHPQFKLWVARVTVVMYLGPGASRLVGLMANLTSLRWAIGPTAVAVGLAIVVLGRVLRSSDGNPHNPLPQK